ncbi:EH signature domain-containing protein [Verminephrobacter aporrectodeae]|uniref:EH signature domain-containing protein n=2 Tax=Verminephrobacter aporrectodeae TaxID=1110389 RepID=UPI002238DE33|nr:EH signature domain-containing protein [Verminephrobacter aporrectodeae]
MPKRFALNDPLDTLRKGLEPFASGLRSPEMFSDPDEGIEEIWTKVGDEHGSAGIGAPTDSIVAVIRIFRETGEIETWRDLRYVCFGLSIPIDDWCVLADVRLLSYVFERVRDLPKMRQRIRGFQALLSSYWGFPLHAEQTRDEARVGWRALRSWLCAEHERIAQSPEPKRPWFAVLTRHTMLLSDNPCEQFGADLLRGDSTGLRDAIEGLAIPVNSWVQEEAVVAQMDAGCLLKDRAFQQTLPALLRIGVGCGGVELGETLRRRCVETLVFRYARCSERPEHMALRDAAVSHIGNPWLYRSRWRDDPSREMVSAWLKHRLISDFFELLSADGMGDRRRMDYWLRFAPAIEDMWFALGVNAQHRHSEPFDEFRLRAQGRLLALDATTHDNNAFVMQVGRYLLVEFGAKGNAMFVFARDSLDQPLLNALHSRARASVSVHQLKDSRHIHRMIHSDSSGQTWEQKFDDDLVPRIGWRPSVAPRGIGGPVRRPRPQVFSPGTWRSFARSHGLRVQDNRSKQGALWVLGVEQPGAVAAQLDAWGFRCRAPKGWFKE